MLLDGALGQDERIGDGGVALALGDLGQDLALPRGELGEGRTLGRVFDATSASTTLGSMTEPPVATASTAETS